MGPTQNPLEGERTSVAAVVFPPLSGSITGRLSWIAIVLAVASALPGMALGLLGLALGVGAAAVGAVALVRLTNKPAGQRRGELLTMLSLGVGVFQVVFALVSAYAVIAM